MVNQYVKGHFSGSSDELSRFKSNLGQTTATIGAAFVKKYVYEKTIVFPDLFQND